VSEKQTGFPVYDHRLQNVNVEKLTSTLFSAFTVQVKLKIAI